jgi:dCTP deaminase
MLLSDVEIKEYMDRGAIVITPFNENQLNNVSYDLTLGDNFAFMKDVDNINTVKDNLTDFYTLEKNLPGVWLGAGERILGHTREFAGGRYVSEDKDGDNGIAVTTQLHATSTAARLGITVCMCAGWGDVGYINRWTLEIQNMTRNEIFLPVGAVICQLSFSEVTPPSFVYGSKGNYQSGNDLAKIMAEWKPEDMLPKRLKVWK